MYLKYFIIYIICLASEVKIKGTWLRSAKLFPHVYFLSLFPSKLHFPEQFKLLSNWLSDSVLLIWCGLTLREHDLNHRISVALHIVHDVAMTTHLLLLNIYFLPQLISFQTGSSLYISAEHMYSFALCMIFLPRLIDDFKTVLSVSLIFYIPSALSQKSVFYI